MFRGTELPPEPSKSDQTYERWRRAPEAFWAEAAESIHWYQKWDQVLDSTRAPFHQWFSGGITNTCYNALDVHVENGRGAQPALIYDSPVTGTVRLYTYKSLLDEVARFAGALLQEGVDKGDRVIIYMPMVPEAMIAMLACARIGAIHSVVFGGFAADQLTTRIDDARPKLVITASCAIEINRVVEYKPILDRAIEMSVHKPERCIVFQRPQAQARLVAERDLDWSKAIAQASPAPCEPMAATDPLYILYTSGTTGLPKGVVRDNGGHLVALKWSMKHIYGMEPGEVFWAASDLGWAVGHSFMVYGPLLHGNTTVMYEGKPVGTPDAGAFWRVVSQHNVSVLFTAPTVLRAIKREDHGGEHIKQHELTNFRMLFLAGERCDPATLLWAQQHLDVPVIDHWWQTETGWPVSANCAGLGLLPIKPGSCGKAVPGYDVRVLDDEGSPLPANQIGNIAIKLPLPPGCLPTLWLKDLEYQETYLQQFPGYYKTADAGFIDDDGYVWIMSRTDDIINVAGHRLSTGAIEEVLSEHPDIAECAVVGVADDLKGEVPLGLVVLNKGVERPSAVVIGELVQMVRDRIGPVASFKVACIVNRLPKTRSGKVVRGTIKKIADGSDYRIPATLEDAQVLTEITTSLKEIGYPRNA